MHLSDVSRHPLRVPFPSQSCAVVAPIRVAPWIRHWEKGALEKGYLHKIVRNWLSNSRQICDNFARPFSDVRNEIPAILHKFVAQKSPSLEKLEVLEILENLHTVENKGEPDHFLEILENLEISEILEIRSQKGPTKPKNRTNSTTEFSEQFEGVTGHYPVKQAFWGKSHQKVHPNCSAKYLSHSFFVVPFLFPKRFLQWKDPFRNDPVFPVPSFEVIFTLRKLFLCPEVLFKTPPKIHCEMN